jgi:hypothetical protein
MWTFALRRLDPAGLRWERLELNPEAPYGPAVRRVAVLDERTVAGPRSRPRPVDRRKPRRIRRA